MLIKQLTLFGMHKGVAPGSKKGEGQLTIFFIWIQQLHYWLAHMGNFLKTKMPPTLQENLQKRKKMKIDIFS